MKPNFKMDKPQYYGKSPASVRYDSALSDFAKVLYPDIEALTRKNGFCHAENGYWAELFGKSERSIRRAISELFSRGHIDIVGDGKARKIYVSNPDKNVLVQDANPDKNVQPTRTNLSKNPDKNVHDIYGNNTIKNTTRENTTSKARERANVVSLDRLIDLLEIPLGSGYFKKLSLREKKSEQMYAHSIFKKICGRIGQDENEPQDLEAVYEAYQDFMTGLSRLEWWKDKMTTAGMIDRKFTDIAQKLIKSNGKAHDDYALAKQIADELQAEGGW